MFRILFASVILADLFNRLPDVSVFYTDDGTLSRRLALATIADDRWSLLFMNGTPEFAFLVILAGIVAALMMWVGARTRIATIVLWIIIVSVQTRNSYLLSGADTLLRVTLFWAMFLPLGAHWSFDARQASPHRRVAKSDGMRFSSVATFGIIAQGAFVYLFTAIMKDGDKWREHGTAVYYALGARDVSNRLGEWLFQTVPEFVFQVMTFGTIVMEFAAPMLLLLPIRSGWMRGIGVAMVVSLQLGIGLSMSVGLFPYIAIASILVVLPGGVWDYLETTAFARQPVNRLSERLAHSLNLVWPVPVEGASLEEQEVQPDPIDRELAYYRAVFEPN